jgi:predicted RNA-binding protein Jag
MKEWIGTANTVDQAVDRGLAALNLSRDQVDVKVLDEESSGLLSMFGYHRVKVRVQEKVRRVERGGRFDWDNGDDRPDRFEDRRSGPGAGKKSGTKTPPCLETARSNPLRRQAPENQRIPAVPC